MPDHLLKSLLVSARTTLEGTFSAIATRHSPRNVWRRVYARGKHVEDPAYWERVYEESAKAVGFSVPLPKALARVKPNDVKSAADYPNGWRLRGATIAALLAARDDYEHPLRQAASQEPKLLELIDDVAKKAGRAVHAGAERPSVQSVLPIVADVYRAVGLLSGLGQP